jgi:hypothetical protein
MKGKGKLLCACVGREERKERRKEEERREGGVMECCPPRREKREKERKGKGKEIRDTWHKLSGQERIMKSLTANQIMTRDKGEIVFLF